MLITHRKWGSTIIRYQNIDCQAALPVTPALKYYKQMAFEYTDKGTNTLSIGFTSFQKIDTTFDWNILKKFETDTLLIRDPKMAWYLCGIGGISKDVTETIEFIHRYTDKYNKILLFGSSMGGYASLLYGSLINHNDKTINAFTPQTDIRSETLILSPWTIGELNNRVYPFIKEYDKKFMFLASLDIPKTTSIHYGKDGTIDKYQANLINCNKLEYNCSTHAISLWMYDNGSLVPYLRGLYK